MGVKERSIVDSVAHAAYLARKLDIKKQELTIREREAEIDGARLELERDRFAWLQLQQAEAAQQAEVARGMFEHLASHADSADDAPVMRRNRGRA